MPGSVLTYSLSVYVLACWKDTGKCETEASLLLFPYKVNGGGKPAGDAINLAKAACQLLQAFVS